MYYDYYYGDPILGKVINLDSKGNPLLLSHRILIFKTFDTVDRNNEKSRNGNLWIESSLRKWLNARGVITTWKGAPPSVDNISDGFNPYDQEVGFLSTENFTPQEYLTIIWTQHNGESITDKMFLLSESESKEYLMDRERSEFAKPTTKAVENMTMGYYWITPSHGASHWLRSVNERGLINMIKNDNVGHTAYGHSFSNTGAVGVRPAFYLDLSKIEFDSGAGYYSYPYYVNVK